MRLLIVYILILLQGGSFSWRMQAVKGDLLSPALGGVCNSMTCGKGTCKVTQSSRFGFECECDPGWNRFWSDDQFVFLPCLIPQSCLWSFCGEGACIQMSGFEHRCECKAGYMNLLNISSLPCFKECKVRADYYAFTSQSS